MSAHHPNSGDRTPLHGSRGVSQFLSSFVGNDRSALARRISARARRLRLRVEVDDVLNEAVLRALLSEQSLQVSHESSMRNWLLRAADNHMISLARRRPHDPAELTVDESFLEDTESSDEDREKIPPAELVSEIWRLPDPARCAILMRNYMALQWDTIAFILGKPTAGAARQQYIRAIALLRTRLSRART